MNIVAISDLHGYLPNNIPECDVVCICGDVSPLQAQSRTHDMRKWLNIKFLPWVESLQCNNIIMVAGNHDFFFQRHPEWQSTINALQTKLIILQDNSVEIEGKTFYGTPWCPDLTNWAFYGSSEELRDKFSLIPSGVDVLLTHCPPKIEKYGTVLQLSSFNVGSDYGSEELAEAIYQKNPKHCFCGHVHSGDHFPSVHGKTMIANVSIKDEQYEVRYEPLIIKV